MREAMIRLMGIAVFLGLSTLPACYRSSGLIVESSNELIRIQLPEPGEVFVERADVSVQCVGCEPSEVQKKNLVNVDFDLVLVPIAFINEELAKYRFTKGSLIAVNATYYDGPTPVLRTCAGDTSSCNNQLFQVSGNNSVLFLEVQFDTIIVKEDDDEEPGDNAGDINENAINNAIQFTELARQSVAPGHCIAEYKLAEQSLGIHAGHYFGEACLIPYGNEIQVINSGVKFVSNRNLEKFDLVWLAPVLLESAADGADTYRPLVVGIENREGQDYPIFACRDRELARYGKTSLRNDGSGRLWIDCHTSMDERGNIAPAVQFITNFEVLSSRAQLNID